MKKLPQLNNLLQYHNPLVVKRFKRNNPKYTDQAEELFSDMLKYLWLSQKHYFDKEQQTDNHALNFNMVMHKEMRIIDEMWHTFILITIDYAKFCDDFFGAFLHHIPEVGGETGEEIKVDINQFEHELRLFLEYTYDHLGENTVKRWFATYLPN